jgi:hypothetical protein
MFIVVFTNRETGETIMSGPFETRQHAQAWAADQADEFAGDERHLIDASEDGDIVTLGADLQWRVEPLIPVVLEEHCSGNAQESAS